MREPIPKPPKKEKKLPKPIAKIGKRGAKKIANKRASLNFYFDRFGWEALEELAADCQICGFPVTRSDANFCHKHRASQSGPETLENGVCGHQLCHSYSHTRRDIEDAITESPANLENGLKVRLTDQQRLDLLHYLGLTHL